MPTIKVSITYDQPTDIYWLNPENVSAALSAHSPNTKFEVDWTENGDPWSLLTCPFCDEEPATDKWHGKTRVSCENHECMANPQVVGETAAEAAERWNQRWR